MYCRVRIGKTPREAKIWDFFVSQKTLRGDVFGSERFEESKNRIVMPVYARLTSYLVSLLLHLSAEKPYKKSLENVGKFGKGLDIP